MTLSGPFPIRVARGCVSEGRTLNIAFNELNKEATMCLYRLFDRTFRDIRDRFHVSAAGTADYKQWLVEVEVLAQGFGADSNDDNYGRTIERATHHWVAYYNKPCSDSDWIYDYDLGRKRPPTPLTAEQFLAHLRINHEQAFRWKHLDDEPPPPYEQEGLEEFRSVRYGLPNADDKTVLAWLRSNEEHWLWGRWGTQHYEVDVPTGAIDGPQPGESLDGVALTKCLEAVGLPLNQYTDSPSGVKWRKEDGPPPSLVCDRWVAEFAEEVEAACLSFADEKAVRDEVLRLEQSIRHLRPWPEKSPVGTTVAYEAAASALNMVKGRLCDRIMDVREGLAEDTVVTMTTFQGLLGEERTSAVRTALSEIGIVYTPAKGKRRCLAALHAACDFYGKQPQRLMDWPQMLEEFFPESKWSEKNTPWDQGKWDAAYRSAYYAMKDRLAR